MNWVLLMNFALFAVAGIMLGWSVRDFFMVRTTWWGKLLEVLFSIFAMLIMYIAYVSNFPG